MQSQPIPKRWQQIVGTDLFSVKKDVDLVVVDNLTKYWDLEQLNDTDTESTILQMKKIFLPARPFSARATFFSWRDCFL